MEAHKNKSLSRMIQCFSLFLVLHLLEQLLIIFKYVDTKGVVACAGGFAILLFYIRFINKPLEEIGMIFSVRKIHKGLLLAFVFNLVSTLTVFGLEYFYFAKKPGYTIITFYYDDLANCLSSAGFLRFLLWAGIGLLIAVINAFFYEMTFRGLLITLGSRSLRFWAINLIQAGLYTFWFMVQVVRLALAGSMSIKLLLIYAVVLLAYEMITAVKLGLLRASTGSVWACIFDHIAFAFILDFVHIQYIDQNLKVSTDDIMVTCIRIVAYQAISLAMVSVYYVIKQKKIRERLREREMQMDQVI